MIAHGSVTRATKDLDLFTEIDDQKALQVTAALRQELQQRGLVIRDAEPRARARAAIRKSVRPPVDEICR